VKRAALAILVALAGCGKEAPQDPAPAGQAAAPQPATPNIPAVPAATARPATSPASATPYTDRTGELSNPENVAMVMLYHDLAGIPAPIARWVEADNRLQFAPGPQKAALREQITAEFEAARNAVKNVGLLRVTLADAQLSDYDPGYGEYTIRALSPSSTIPYKALGTDVTLKFDNARNAQLWRVPAEDAQRIADTLGTHGRAALDLTLAVTGVVPGTAGGTITTRIVEYELRTQRGGQTLTRAKPGQ
jgi:predicted small lipoprotein YifL